MSEKDGTTINEFVTIAVAEKISAMRTDEFFASHRDGADIEVARRLLRRGRGKPPEPEDYLPRAPWGPFRERYAFEHQLSAEAKPDGYVMKPW